MEEETSQVQTEGLDQVTENKQEGEKNENQKELEDDWAEHSSSEDEISEESSDKHAECLIQSLVGDFNFILSSEERIGGKTS